MAATGQFFPLKKDVVRKQIGMNDPRRQPFRPGLLDRLKLVREFGGEAWQHQIRLRLAALE